MNEKQEQDLLIRMSMVNTQLEKISIQLKILTSGMEFFIKTKK